MLVVQGWCLDFTVEPQLADLMTPSKLAPNLAKYRRLVPAMDEKVFRMIQEAASRRRDTSPSIIQQLVWFFKKLIKIEIYLKTISEIENASNRPLSPS
jgi:hypothetical protein